MPNPFTHIDSLFGVSFYQAPEHARVTPVTIPRGIEIIELLTGGTVDFESGSDWASFGRGGCFCHQGGDRTIWRTTPEAPYRCIVFHFKVRDDDRVLPRVSQFRELRKLDAFAAECMELFHAPEADRSALGCYIYGTLLRQTQLHGERPLPGGGAGADSPALNRMLEYIGGNLERELGLDQLCAAGNVSRAQVFRLFREHLGGTPHDYIFSRRMALARRLLAGTPLSVKEIAESCGFPNIEVFYRNFRKAVGRTPAGYRRNCAAYNFTRTGPD